MSHEPAGLDPKVVRIRTISHNVKLFTEGGERDRRLYRDLPRAAPRA